MNFVLLLLLLLSLLMDIHSDGVVYAGRK